MAQPTTVNDTVLYNPKNLHADQNIQLNLLDSSQLDIWGPVFVNGQPLATIGMIPIATQAEAEAGTDNTKAMTPLRVSQHLAANSTSAASPNIVAKRDGSGNIKIGDALVGSDALNLQTANFKYVQNVLYGAKGDILVGQGPASFGSVGVGTNGQVLTADSTDSFGVKWATPVGGAGVTDGDKGEITVSGSGATWTIDNSVVTNAKLASLAAYRIKGNISGVTSTVSDMTPAQARVALASDAGGTTNFFRADGTFAAPPGGAGVTDGDKGDIVVSGSGTSWLFDSSVVTAAAKTVLDDTTTAAMLTTLGGATVAYVDAKVVGLDEFWIGPTAPADTTMLWADTSVVGIEENARYLQTVSSTSYTLALADRGKVTLFSAASAVVVTVPTNASVGFIIGTQLDLVQYGAGVVTVSPAGGVTIRATPSAVLRTQYSSVSLIKINTDEWLLVGDLA